MFDRVQNTPLENSLRKWHHFTKKIQKGYLSEYIEYLLTLLFPMFSFDAPENIRKPDIFYPLMKCQIFKMNQSQESEGKRNTGKKRVKDTHTTKLPIKNTICSYQRCSVRKGVLILRLHQSKLLRIHGQVTKNRNITDCVYTRFQKLVRIWS